VKDAARAFPGQVAVGIDARDGRVSVHGWAETTDMQAIDLARAFEKSSKDVERLPLQLDPDTMLS
jgi:phosphoribosylformimino-5-aminoimidazole carboxamide ribonucleotide (ProFAR) isomerase